MSGVPPAGPSTVLRRRRRRTAITLAVLLLFLLAAFGYAFAYYRGWLPQDDAATTSTPRPTTTPTDAPLLQPSTITVNVYNATDRNGLAARTADQLRSRDFAVAEVANDPLDQTVVGVAQIRHGINGEDAARTMLAHLPEAELELDDRGGTTIDVVLGQEFDGLGSVPATT